MNGASLAGVSLISMTRFAEAALPRRSVLDGRALDPDDPAVYAITDFTREYPMTVDAERPIDDALIDMIRLGVRALLAARAQRLVGLITSYDIQGERPMQFLESSTFRRHQDIRVADIMTPWDRLWALEWRSVEAARAADLLSVFEETGLTHLLIVETPKPSSATTVRALASRARLMRQLKSLPREGTQPPAPGAGFRDFHI